jgi:hypothetical protein
MADYYSVVVGSRCKSVIQVLHRIHLKMHITVGCVGGSKTHHCWGFPVRYASLTHPTSNAASH